MDIHVDETPAGGDVVDRLVEVQAAMARLAAVQADLLVEAADPAERVDEFWVQVPASQEEKRLRIADTVREELGCALRIPHARMQDMIDTARLLHGPLAATKAALAAGAITMDHVRVIADAAGRLPGHLMRDPAETEQFTAACARLQDRVLPVAIRGTTVDARRAARRAVLAIDADGVLRRRREAMGRRDVWISSEGDGTSLLIARMACEQAIAVKTAIHAAGFDRAYSVDAKAGLTLGEHRVEALAAMILSGDPAGPAPVTAHLNLTIDLPTLLALRDSVGPAGHADPRGHADLAGEGAVSVAVVRDLLADPDTTVTLRRLVTDPITGHLLDYGRQTYAIPKALRDYVIARDRTCRFPGCNRRADLCQIDHATAWNDGGETTPGNLGALCTRHHQLKTHAGWTITTSRPDGTCQWRSPHGRTYESGAPEEPEPPPDHGMD